MELKNGVIKVNSHRFQPVIVYALGSEWKWNKEVDNILLCDVVEKQKGFAYDNLGKEVEFYIDKKDCGIIKKIL